MANQLFRKKLIPTILREAEEGLTDGHGHHEGLKKVLGVRDLTALGIAAIIGAGIFSTVGRACFDGGPGVIILFIITAIACAFSALCYAEFASRVPVSGSAYTYSYVAFGELIAWIIGWDLIMEYAVGNVTVAISWSGNLSSFLHNMGVHIPDFLSTSFFEAKSGNAQYLNLLSKNDAGASDFLALHNTWINAPHLGPLPIILNFPALLITALITWLVYRGIKESRTSSNIMVLFKLIVIIAVIAIGFYYVNPDNWTPFMPNHFSGVMKGVSAVFFAYIGFDAISTTAEECKNPQRDLPKGMFYSLIICTILYILIALVLTGMVNYTKLNTSDFLANAF
ncbi:MAG: amino acid permease, partial [Ginsengibacter sp.]